MTRARIAIALTAVVAAALLPAASVLLQFASSSDWYRPRADPFSAFERRYAPLRDALRGESAVGYLAPNPTDSAAARAHFYMTRYVLVPVHVLEDPDGALVVADGVTDRGRVPPDLTVRRDFGNGLLLLERVAR